jgi:CheY-like chemotaxis protein
MHKLLLADDSVTIQRVIELTFSGEDIDVVAVNDGEQAIARIPTEHPDIVLADIGMPKKGGYDVAAFVKGRTDLEHIPVLLLAGAFEPVDQARAEQVRCDGVLIKPFEPRQVIERVRELLEGVKGSAARATADVPRPVDVLAPRSEPQPTPRPAILAESATIVVSDAALDEYFESLNNAFDSVGPAGSPVAAIDTPEAPPVDAPRRRGDSLDDYFDRLSNAFEQGKPADVPHPPADAFEEAADERRVPTVDALVAGPKPVVNGHGTTSGLNGHARNPIVAALEAMLGHPEPVPLQQMLPGLPDTHVNGNGAAAAPPSDLADCVTERVLERLVPEITATVQRLVREEIDRLKH